MKKRIVSIIACLVIMMGTVLTAFASEPTDAFDSSLGDEFSYEMTLGDIQTDILNYIAFNNLGIEYGSEEFSVLMNDFAFAPPAEVSETAQMYYSAYASVYLGEESIDAMHNKTIAEIRKANQSVATKIQQAYSEPSETKPYVAYNLKAAQDYAYAYALVDNFNYPVFRLDCTNFASQILHAGGFGTTSKWNVWAGADTEASFNWINASGFLQYWSLTRGYLGPVCTSLSQVNSKAYAGDFLVWFNTTTYEFYHTQFVQSKVNGEVYCTQHTSYYFNQKLNDRVSASAFPDKHVYIVKFN